MITYLTEREVRKIIDSKIPLGGDISKLLVPRESKFAKKNMPEGKIHQLQLENKS